MSVMLENMNEEIMQVHVNVQAFDTNLTEEVWTCKLGGVSIWA